MANLIDCPSCHRRLNVPDDLLGASVQCPACGLIFILPRPAAPAKPPAAPPAPQQTPTALPPPVTAVDVESLPEVLPADEPMPRRPPDEVLPADDDDERWTTRRPRTRYRDLWDWDEEYRRARGNVLPAGIWLLLVGVLGVVMDLLMVSTAVFNPEQFTNPPPSTPAFVRDMLKKANPNPKQIIVQEGVCAVVSLFIIVAAVQMLRMRTWGLAMAGAILAMINYGSSCCILGIPVGLWSLAVLLRSEVRAAFAGHFPTAEPPEDEPE
jgi:hypothetical protein